jgi:hypothetical protein
MFILAPTKTFSNFKDNSTAYPFSNNVLFFYCSLLWKIRHDLNKTSFSTGIDGIAHRGLIEHSYFLQIGTPTRIRHRLIYNVTYLNSSFLNFIGFVKR